MPARTIGIVIDGATGRLGTTQHLRALLAIAGEGGLALANGDRLCRSRCCSGATRRSSRHWLRRAAASTGAPTAMPASPIRRSRSISTPARPAGAPSAPAPPLPPANTSIWKSRSPRLWRTRCRSLAPPSMPAGRAVSSRTNCSCPDLRNYVSFMMRTFSAACCRCGSILAGGCSTARSPRRSGRAGIIKGPAAAG